MAYHSLQVKQTESIVLSHGTTERLLKTGHGNATLLYLFLLQRGQTVSGADICSYFHWTVEQLREAESVLQQMELVSGSASEEVVKEPAQETPEYTREDICQVMKSDVGFETLVNETENRLGRKCTTKDLQQLLGLYHEQGLPITVLMMLVVYCIDQVQHLYGPGRKPTVRAIEREGFYWARMGLFTEDEVEKYLKKKAESSGKIPEMMTVLRLGNRLPSPTEEKYLTDWIDWGFTPEMVALAYDKTVLKCKEFKWNYANGIIRRWKEKGVFTAEQANSEQKKPSGVEQQGNKEQRDVSQLQKYVKQLRQQNKKEDKA